MGVQTFALKCINYQISSYIPDSHLVQQPKRTKRQLAKAASQTLRKEESMGRVARGHALNQGDMVGLNAKQILIRKINGLAEWDTRGLVARESLYTAWRLWLLSAQGMRDTVCHCTRPGRSL